MAQIGIGAGLAAVGFWIFVAIAVVAGIWNTIRKREAQHETLRRMVESGQQVDPDMLDRLVPPGGGDSADLDRDLRVGGLICLWITPGLAVMAVLLSLISDEALYPVLGAAVLLGCVSMGLLAASSAVRRWYREDATQHRP